MQPIFTLTCHIKSSFLKDMGSKSKAKAEKIKNDLYFMMSMFREVLSDEKEDSIGNYLPWIGNNPPENPEEFPPKLPHAYSISFELLNMVEENVDAQLRRRKENVKGISCNTGLWGYNFNRILKNGFSEKDIETLVPDLHIEPVLTAHPTEAKRASVLEHHHDIYENLVKLENSMFTDAERHIIEENIKTTIETLWRTGEIAGKKPEVLDELNNILHYLRDIFPEALKRLDDRLKSAWNRFGLRENFTTDPDNFPRITFGNWVGGDRDGHPFVTPEITEKTLLILKGSAIQLIKEYLIKMAKKLSISDRLQKVPEYISQKIERMIAEDPENRKFVHQRNAGESIRKFINLMILKLPQAPEKLEENAGMEESNFYQSAEELVYDLRLLRRALAENNSRRIANRDAFHAIRLVKTFGFHLAVLDIRQNSLYHEKAFAQILSASGINPENYLTLSDDEKYRYLCEELKSPRPYLPRNSNPGEEAKNVLQYFEVLRKYISQFGTAGIGTYIVSMTRNASDLILVYIFAREAGLLENKEGRMVFSMSVSPLFETVEDLQNAPQILDEYFKNPITQNSMDENLSSTRKTQTVMVGYSDSNKDGGIISSNWNLVGAQKKMVETAEKHQIKLRFFHGKGGTISRGAGPTHRFLEALPAGSVGADIRITEQGESISQKYANFTGATYNLELLAAGVLGATLIHPSGITSKTIILDFLAQKSKEKYESLVTHEDFIRFFNLATPIDAIEKAQIGSRPSRRSGRKTIADLRAIPWVFSWNQSRFYLPGWFGAGTSLHELYESRPEDYNAMKSNIHSWPVARYIFTNIETSISSANIDIMRDYASLVPDHSLRDTFFDIIEREYHLTQKMLNDLFGGNMEDRRPGLLSTLHYRAEPLRLLHKSQLYLLKKFRSAQNDEERDELLPRLLQSINAIAAGLRTTG